MNRIVFIVFFILIFFSSCKEVVTNEDSLPKTAITSGFDFLPTSTTEAVYSHSTYVFSYSEVHEQSEWVAYFLEKEDITNSNFKRPFFAQDPLVESESADWRNFKNSGYDKGHLCPAGDRKKSIEDYNETFFTSNVSPQKHDFNSGIWNRLEEKVRYWAIKYDGLYVITGGVLTNDLKTIGKERVAVPNYFYKVLLSKNENKMIGFLIPHQESKSPLYEFVVSVDEIEKITGIDFFPKMPDSLENELESKSDYKEWSF
ncbi:DNA/RNA non-specific endonuclease [Flavobacterium sp.]|uniref:DNA/RNA non-specific endonuclease n=2 Tax=Flavobacterium sp. TaxID=239 RepID=UPI00404714E2